MKQQLHSLFMQAVDQLKNSGVIAPEQVVQLNFERTRQKEHGDFATNLALTLAKAAQCNPRELAQMVVDALPQDPLVLKTEIAGPGFINIFLQQDAKQSVLLEVFQKAQDYGYAESNSKQKIMVEFVSANPTGPLHVGHGRGAAYGDALARLLAAAGNQVEREYYVNDAGRQMDILAFSVWVRYIQCFNAEIELPENCYKGQYVSDMGRQLAHQHGDKYRLTEQELKQARGELDDEAAMDAGIQLLKDRFDKEGFDVFFRLALTTIQQDIQEDLSGFGVDYDNWFSEQSLFDDGKIDAAIEQLKQSDYLYEKGGAWWFRSTALGDEKDRVVVRDNGQPTYFASDIAYHKDKVDRGFDLCINIWGSDHHGYIPRVKASMQALGLDPDKLAVQLVQFAVLYRGAEKVSMSTRSGQFVSLRELRDEVGADAARFFYVQRKSEQHMDFDLDLAKSQSKDNPLYYVQYAHARIGRIFRTAEEREIKTSAVHEADFSQLTSEKEDALLTLIRRFPELIEGAAEKYEPHQLSYYLRDLANAFHSYYDSTKILQEEDPQRKAMLALCAATKQVLANGLGIIGVAAPETM